MLLTRISCYFGGTIAPLSNGIYLPPFQGAIQNIAKIVRENGRENFFVISRPQTQACRDNMSEWLKERDFCSLTGVLPENIITCQQPQEQIILHQDLHITHVIANLVSDFENLSTQVFGRIMYIPDSTQGGELERLRDSTFPVIVTASWNNIPDMISVATETCSPPAVQQLFKTIANAASN